MYKKAACLILFFASLAFCQRPGWITNTPTAAQGANYYYRVAEASDRNAETARRKAYDNAVEASVHAHGIARELRTDSVGAATVSQRPVQFRLPMDLVCEHRVDLIERAGVRVWLLFRVANSANVVLEHVPFDCGAGVERLR